MAVSSQRRVARYPILFFSLSLCLLAVTGCSFPDAYTGPFRNPDEVAVLTSKAIFVGNQGYEDAYINSIDGEKAIGGWRAPGQEVHLLPGFRSIGLVRAKVIDAAESGEEFKDEVVLRVKFIVGARYALAYNPTTKRYVVARVGLGEVPFEIVE